MKHSTGRRSRATDNVRLFYANQARAKHAGPVRVGGGIEGAGALLKSLYRFMR
jgi:hypothetical protein